MDGGEGRNIVGKCVAHTKGRLAISKDVPRQPGPGTEILVVIVVDVVEASRTEVEKSRARRDGAALTGRRRNKVSALQVGIGDRRIYVPAQAQGHCDPRRELPFIGEKQAECALRDAPLGCPKDAKGLIEAKQEQLRERIDAAR